MPSFQTFKDLSVTFKSHPVTNDLVAVKDKAAISQAIQNLLMTKKGERPFQPQLGSGLMDMLFEPLDYGSSALIKKEIRQTINRYEPRITIDRITCTIDFDNNGYSVELVYKIVGRDDKPVTVEFFLERTR